MEEGEKSWEDKLIIIVIEKAGFGH